MRRIDMRYSEVPPAPPLRPFVECLWLLEGKPGLAPEVVTPDGRTEVLVHFGDPVERLDPFPGREPSCLFFGPLDRPLTLLAGGRLGIAAARLTPIGAWSLVGRGAPGLANRPTALDEMWGGKGRELEGRVRSAPDDRSRLEALERALLERLASGPSVDPLIALAVDLFQASRGCASVHAVAGRCAISRRQLERRFRIRVGLAPKTFARLTRFQGVLRHATRSRAPRWSYLAAAYGYFDQAHLIRDFRRFAGVPPGAWLRQRHEMSDRFLSTGAPAKSG